MLNRWTHRELNPDLTHAMGKYYHYTMSPVIRNVLQYSCGNRFFNIQPIESECRLNNRERVGHQYPLVEKRQEK